MKLLQNYWHKIPPTLRFLLLPSLPRGRHVTADPQQVCARTLQRAAVTDDGDKDALYQAQRLLRHVQRQLQQHKMIGA